MGGGRTYDEDVSYWCGFENGEETERADDPMLAHLTDIEILGLGDSYDDGRIDTLALAYIVLREKLLGKIE